MDALDDTALVGNIGKYLSLEHEEMLRKLIPEFATKVLLPYAGKQIHTLTKLVSV